ncbi:MAG: cupin domain-containing protein [Desulfobacterota bacterium]|nr:cupin domain-containing protein [Thermodesulfobacteriota bacterium]
MKIVRFSQKDYVPASHENPDAPGVWKKVLLRHEDVIDGRIQMINWARLPVGAAFQAHYHEDMQEVFIILNGTVRLIVNAEACELAAGDAVVIPIGALHVMHNICDEDVCYVAIGITREGRGKTVVVDGSMSGETRR